MEFPQMAYTALGLSLTTRGPESGCLLPLWSSLSHLLGCDLFTIKPQCWEQFSFSLLQQQAWKSVILVHLHKMLLSYKDPNVNVYREDTTGQMWFTLVVQTVRILFFSIKSASWLQNIVWGHDPINFFKWNFISGNYIILNDVRQVLNKPVEIIILQSQRNWNLHFIHDWA